MGTVRREAVDVNGTSFMARRIGKWDDGGKRALRRSGDAGHVRLDDSLLLAGSVLIIVGPASPLAFEAAPKGRMKGINQ
jgi:hypothetical protein